MSESLKIDYGDGVSALDRTMRAITMLADGAIGRLLDLGWQRKSINMQINNDSPLPCYVILPVKKRMFEIKATPRDDGTILIEGVWLEEPKAPSIIDRFWGR